MHDAVDALFGRFDLTNPSSYADFLEAQAGAFIPVEHAVEAQAGALLEDWPDRRRSHLLSADLGLVGREPEIQPAPDYSTSAAALGAIYVLEGSRLGAQVLRRSLPPGAPAAFMTAPVEPKRWRGLIATLEARLDRPDALSEALVAARDVFGRFEASARKVLGRSERD